MATTYQWVRHLGSVSPFGGITSAVSNNFAAYAGDDFFGVRSVISPVPNTLNVDYTWRSRAYRAGNRLFDIEWRYRRTGTSAATLAARNYNHVGVPGAWIDQTAMLAGMPTGTLVLDSVFAAANSFATQDPDLLEDFIAGTTDVQYEYAENGVILAGGIGTPSGVLGVGGFDIRFLAVKNLRAEKPVTNLSSEENTINIKADIMALPASTSLFPTGWTPTSDVSYALELGNESGSEIYWAPPLSSAPVSPSAGAGKVAEIDLDAPGSPGRWDGLDLNGEAVQGLSVFVALARADNPDGMTFSLSALKASACVTYLCASCSVGSNNQAVAVESTASPSGDPLDSTMSYTGLNFGAYPASAGYGWASQASSRIIDQPGELIFKSAGGSSLRWVEQGGSYVPFSTGNYVEASVDLGSSVARYLLTFKDQTVMEFDAAGKLTRKVDRNGNALSYFYNATTGHLETIDDGNGRSHHYTNRPDGQPLTLRVNDPVNGRLTQFLYHSPTDPDAPDRLFRIIDAELNETDFYYYENGPMLASIDPQGNVAAFYRYDSFARLYQEELYGEVLRTHYRNFNNLTGRSTLEVIEQDMVGSEPDRSVYMEFDRHGNVVRQLQLVDSAVVPAVYNETLFEYNDPYNPNLLTRQIDPNLTVTEMTYTASGNLKTSTDKDGNVTTYTYAEEIDSPLNPKHRNLVRQIQRPDVTVGGVSVSYNPTVFEYDLNGNLVKVIDAAQEETTMTYTADGLVETITNRLGHTAEIIYEGIPFNGDSRRLLSGKTPKGDTSLDGFREIRYTYDDYDNVVSITNDLHNQETAQYDRLDRFIQVTDALGKVTTNDYVAMLLQDVVMPANNGSSNSLRTTSMVYDSSNRLVEVNRDVSGSAQQLRVKYGYNSFSQMAALTRIKNNAEKSFTFAYDQIGRMVQAADSLPVPGVTTNAYEPFCVGHTTTSARGVRRKTSFDNRCLLTQIESGSIDAGDPLEIINRRELREMEYDELGRLIKVSQTRSAANTPTVIGIDIYGGSPEERLYEYDELDRLVNLTFEDSSEMRWQYDAEGRVTQVTNPEGNVTEYTYYRDNLLKEVIVKRSSQADRVFTYKYDDAGRMLEIEFPSATQVVAKFDDGTNTDGSGWDAKGQLRHLRYEINGTLIRRFEYSYDDSGNRASQLDVTPTKAVKWEYVYDWLDRLEIVRRAEAATVAALPSTLPTISIYSYDASDNRIEFQVPQDDLIFTYEVDDADNLLSVSSQEGSDPVIVIESFIHDEDGNMTTRTNELTNEVIDYSWDDFDRLVKVSSAISGTPTSTAKVDNRFDAGGIRKRKLDKNGNSSSEFTASISTAASKAAAVSSTSPTISYLMGHQLLGAEINGNFQFWLMDTLGSVRDVVDDFGVVIQNYEFNEHGIPMPGSGATSGAFGSKTYQGGLSVNDDRNDSGLYLMGHRHFAAELGRFVSKDPIGFAGGLNLLAAHAINPLGAVDPSGLASIEVSYAGQVKGTDILSSYPNNARSQNPPESLPVYNVKLISEENGKREVLAEATWATSGWEGYLPMSIDPSHQQIPDRGPTPRGVYRIFCGEIADLNFPQTEHVNCGWRIEELNSDSWGGARVPLQPVRGPGDFPYGRSDMYIHLHRNNSRTRTGGCIGLLQERGGADFFDQLNKLCRKLVKSGFAENGKSPSIRVTVKH